MAIFEFRTASEQVVDYLRTELSRRRWTGNVPGSNALAKELGVGKSTIETALGLLEQEGLLFPQGAGRPRRINPRKLPDDSALKVQVLLRDDLDRSQELMLELLRQLQLSGHSAEFSAKTLEGMKMSAKRVARFVSGIEVDAWIVLGANRETLKWFAGQAKPAYAIYGCQASVNIAGTGILKTTALARAVQRLVELGHRRIVMLSRPERRKPNPGEFERHFLDTLGKYGIHTGSFNLPDWEDEPADFRRCLDALYTYTPPTALIFDQPHLYFAGQQHLCQQGLIAPREVSLFCNEPESAFGWSEPAVSHIRWDSGEMIKHVVHWVNHLRLGTNDTRQTRVEAEFVAGGTIGPVPGRTP